VTPAAFQQLSIGISWDANAETRCYSPSWQGAAYSTELANRAACAQAPSTDCPEIFDWHPTMMLVVDSTHCWPSPSTTPMSLMARFLASLSTSTTSA
jgi:hypothetical protein